jgi:hypothetical protein
MHWGAWTLKKLTKASHGDAGCRRENALQRGSLSEADAASAPDLKAAESAKVAEADAAVEASNAARLADSQKLFDDLKKAAASYQVRALPVEKITRCVILSQP